MTLLLFLAAILFPLPFLMCFGGGGGGGSSSSGNTSTTATNEELGAAGGSVVNKGNAGNINISNLTPEEVLAVLGLGTTALNSNTATSTNAINAATAGAATTTGAMSSFASGVLDKFLSASSAANSAAINAGANVATTALNSNTAVATNAINAATAGAASTTGLMGTLANNAINAATTQTHTMSDFASGVVNSSLSSNAQTVQGVLGRQADILAAVVDLAKGNAAQNAQSEANIGQITSGALQGIQALAQATNPTGATTDMTKNLMYVGLAVAASVAVLAFGRK